MLWGIFSFEYCPLCFGANHLVLFFLFFSNIKTLIAQRDAPICQYLKKLNINFHNYKKTMFGTKSGEWRQMIFGLYKNTRDSSSTFDFFVVAISVS